MARRLHVAQTERKLAPAPAPVLNSDLLRYVAKDINHAKANLEPRLFHAAVHLLQSPSAPVAPLLARADTHRWQGMIDTATARVQRAQFEATQAARVNAANATLETSAAQTRAAQAKASDARSASRQAIARTQYWHAQIQRFGIGSYARHYEDHSDFQIRSANLESSGQALHPVLLEALEAHFQQKMPAIQIHSDTSAASRAREVGALAFTSGAGIHFGAGQYQPFTPEGFKLLVHETTHVLQQINGIVPEGIDTDPSLERAAQLEASRVTNTPSLNAPTKPSISSQAIQSQPVQNQAISSLPFETPGQWAAHLLNTLKSHSVPRERFAVVAELYTQIPVDQQGKAKALMLGKLNPNSSEHQRLEASLVVTPSVNAVKSSGSSAKPRQPGEMNFFTYLNPTERDIVLPNYKTFPVSSDAVKNAQFEPAAPTLSRSSLHSARAPRQPFRATHATSRSIQRQAKPAPEQPKELKAINAIGVVFNKAGANSYAKPNTSGKDKASERLEFNEHVMVIREIEGGWYQVSTLHGIRYVNKTFLRVYPSDAGANLHRVTKGQTAIGIAEQYYGRLVKGGTDLRYFVNVLALVNPNALKAPTGDDWKKVAFNKDTTIYVPEPVFAMAQQGKVSDGSFTNGLYSSVMNSLEPVGDIVRSSQESFQFIPEVLGELWEVIKENKLLIISTTAALMFAEFVVGLAAAIPEPTMLTKILAMLLQGLIVAVIGVGAIVSFGQALNEGLTWLTTAWNAKGRYGEIKKAGKAYLKMLGNFALGILAIWGLRGSLGRFAGMYAKYKAQLPKVQSEPTIASPLKGNPKAIWRGYASLSRIQQEVLNQLPGKGSQTVIPKGTFRLKDLAALSASTGDEFAMFTMVGRRLIMRGTRDGVPVNQELAASLASKGWRWSAHTHPDGSLRSSVGDRLILSEFENKQSAILTSEGTWKLFNQNGDLINSSWLP